MLETPLQPQPNPPRRIGEIARSPEYGVEGLDGQVLLLPVEDAIAVSVTLFGAKEVNATGRGALTRLVHP